MKQEYINEIKGILLFAFALILLTSLLSFTPQDIVWFTSQPNDPAKNLISVAGAYTAASILFALGYSAYLLVVFLFFWSWNIFTSRKMVFNNSRLICLAVLVFVMAGLFSLMGSAIAVDRFARGGFVGLLFSDFLSQYFGVMGAYIILFALAVLCLVITAEFLLSPLFLALGERLLALWHAWQDDRAAMFSGQAKGQVKKKNSRKKKSALGDDEEYEYVYEEVDEEVAEDADEDSADKDKPVVEDAAAKARRLKAIKPKIRILKQNQKEPERLDKPLVVGDYQLPPFDLLDDAPEVSQDKVQESLVSGAKTLESTLESFGVSVRVVDIERGPVITRYELQPAAGVRVQNITTLQHDIALAMEASSIRIQAPIPGTNRVGIEVPNGAKAAVFLKDVLLESDMRNSPSKLTLALGKEISGRPMMADLADMPHMLVAGATGAGKSVCINSLIVSMLYNAAPNEVKFIMIDPKMVELAQYNDLPHMLCPAITDHKKAVSALNWVVSEMESRYKMLAKNKVRNIKAYHEKGFEMPYIVIIIDEFADLMQTSGKTIEASVTRLAQLARAVGIHLILATQRPSVNVITGVIKANFPSRVAFKVASQVDSRTILDTKGADELLGKGDMLFMRPGDPKPTRGQCSFLSDEEIHRVVEFIAKQQRPEYDDSVTTKSAMGGGAGGGDSERDELYEEAVEVVMQTGQASVSILQRRLKIGYSRAGRLLDSLEESGIVGPHAGSKARDILIDRDEWMVAKMEIETENVKGASEDDGKCDEAPVEGDDIKADLQDETGDDDEDEYFDEDEYEEVE